MTCGDSDRFCIRSAFAFSERWRTCWPVFKAREILLSSPNLEVRVSPEHVPAGASWGSVPSTDDREIPMRRWGDLPSAPSTRARLPEIDGLVLTR